MFEDCDSDFWIVTIVVTILQTTVNNDFLKSKNWILENWVYNKKESHYSEPKAFS